MAVKGWEELRKFGGELRSTEGFIIGSEYLILMLNLNENLNVVIVGLINTYLKHCIPRPETDDVFV